MKLNALGIDDNRREDRMESSAARQRRSSDRINDSDRDDGRGSNLPPESKLLEAIITRDRSLSDISDSSLSSYDDDSLENRPPLARIKAGQEEGSLLRRTKNPVLRRVPGNSESSSRQHNRLTLVFDDMIPADRDTVSFLAEAMDQDSEQDEPEVESFDSCTATASKPVWRRRSISQLGREVGEGVVLMGNDVGKSVLGVFKVMLTDSRSGSGSGSDLGDSLISSKRRSLDGSATYDSLDFSYESRGFVESEAMPGSPRVWDNFDAKTQSSDDSSMLEDPSRRVIWRKFGRSTRTRTTEEENSTNELSTTKETVSSRSNSSQRPSADGKRNVFGKGRKANNKRAWKAMVPFLKTPRSNETRDAHRSSTTIAPYAEAELPPLKKEPSFNEAELTDEEGLMQQKEPAVMKSLIPDNGNKDKMVSEMESVALTRTGEETAETIESSQAQENAEIDDNIYPSSRFEEFKSLKNGFFAMFCQPTPADGDAFNKKEAMKEMVRSTPHLGILKKGLLPSHATQASGKSDDQKCGKVVSPESQKTTCFADGDIRIPKLTRLDTRDDEGVTDKAVVIEDDCSKGADHESTKTENEAGFEVIPQEIVREQILHEHMEVEIALKKDVVWSPLEADHARAYKLKQSKPLLSPTRLMQRMPWMPTATHQANGNRPKRQIADQPKRRDINRTQAEHPNRRRNLVKSRTTTISMLRR